MNIKLQVVFLVIILFIFLIGLIWTIKTEKRLKRFFLGKKGKDLEDTIINLQEEISELKKAKENAEKNIKEINLKLKKSIRGLETIRFNPFPDQGSNQSFAIGMLNEDGDGVVLSSLYSRERMSIFAKPIKSGKSEYELTEEEASAIKKATIK